MSTRFLSHAIAISAVLVFLANPSAVYASYTSALVGSTATMTGNVAADTLSITQDPVLPLFRHNRATAGDPLFFSDFDFDTTVAGDQTVSSVTGIININAGDGNDTITIAEGLNIRGAVDGGLGSDTLSYAAYAAGIGANLGLNTSGLSATLGADQENPPTTHAGTGTATVSNYNIFTHTFDINVTVLGLPPGDVNGFHIHQAAVGVNGPIIVEFDHATGLVPAGTGFTFTATGLTLPTVNEAAFLGGGTYVNIHTAAFPTGAIRGQLFSGGNVNVTPGTATGLLTVANVENAIGGAVGDSLVGNNAVNTMTGGPGADWIVGGAASDTLNGDAGADVLVWSNGDGTDVMEGGADIDTVQVNGNTLNADVFVVSAGAGERLDFDRTGAGAFSLDIGTVETLTVNGIGGNDTTSVNNLVGVAALTTVNLNGFDGADGFLVGGTSPLAFALNIHGGNGNDALQGPNSTMTWNVAASNLGDITGVVTAFRFVETLIGGSGSDTFNVRAFATGTATQVLGDAGADTLNYNAESRPFSGDTTPPDGVIDSPGVQSVTFNLVETVNIVNPPPTISITDVTVAEGSTAHFTVTLSNPSLLTVSVNFATADGTATAPGDYTAQSGMRTFVPGATIDFISVPVGTDAIDEPPETFFVNLSGAVNATIADAQGQGTITNGAAPPPPPPPPVNQPPTLAGLADTTIEESKTLTLTLAVGDDQTPAENLFVTASSSNTALLPASGLVLGGAGGTRTLTLTPVAEATGLTTLTVTVSDGALNTVRTALLTVVASLAPLPPTGLTGGAVGTQVTLTWVEATLGAAPTFDVIEGGTAPGGTTLPVIVTPTRVTQWTLQLPAGVYFFRVRAANRAGTSPPSNEATVVVTSTTPLPGSPTGLAAVVAGLHVTLAWLRPTVGGTPDAWQLELGSAAGGIDRGVIGVPPDVTAVSGNLPAGEYFARVRGVNSAGSGPASNETRFRVGEPPPCDAPQPPVLLPATVNGRTITLAWRAPRNVAVGNYRLLVGSIAGGSDLAILDVGPVTSFVASAPPGRYHVMLLATNACGTSTPSNPIEVVVGSADTPPAPANLRATVNGRQVSVAWDAVAGVMSYVLEAGLAPGLSNAATFPLTATGLTVNGVPSGTYYVRVRAIGAGGTSAPSAEVVIVVP